MELFCGVLGTTASEEMAQMAALLLDSKALTWWRSVTMESWVKLGVCMWPVF